MEEKDENGLLALVKIIISIILLFVSFIPNVDVLPKFLLLFISYLIVSYDVLITAIKNIFNGKVFDETFLMTIATIGTFFVREFEEGVTVMLLYKIGEFLQDKAVDNSKKSITNLLNLKSSYANLKSSDGYKVIPPENLKIGDLIVVKVGEKVPVDGEVIAGTSYMDTSLLTGESMPKKVRVKDEVLSGYINKDSLLTIKVTKPFSDSTANKMLDLVENSSTTKSRSEKFITKFTRIYTPIVVLIAFLIAIICPVFLNIPLYDSIYKSLICLVIACPCALVISIPLSYFAGIGAASKNGILVKGANYLDELTNVDTVVFDKTGTITKGVFGVTKIYSKKLSDEELIKYAAHAEVFSNHPISKSILKRYDKKIDESAIKNYKEMPGYGIEATVFKKKMLIGNKKLLEKNGVTFEEANEDGTVIYVSIDNEYAGYIIISDTIKNDSITFLDSLKKLGIDVVLLTGDNYSSASSICKKLGIKKFYTNMLPHDKVSIVEKLILKGKNIAFVGDGINDAPVLARSNVGISMGGIGSDAAVEASDIVLMNDNLNKIIDSIMIAKKTKKIVIENIILSLVIKLLVFSLGALGFATMWTAIVADVGVTLIAVINSFRCLKYGSKV